MPDVHRGLTVLAKLRWIAHFGPHWMGYRLLQAQLLWALDHIARYGAGPGLTPRELENTYCDAEYGAIAAHADCLLTRDRGLANQFRIMAPDVGCEAQL